MSYDRQCREFREGISVKEALAEKSVYNIAPDVNVHDRRFLFQSHVHVHVHDQLSQLQPRVHGSDRERLTSFHKCSFFPLRLAPF